MSPREWRRTTRPRSSRLAIVVAPLPLVGRVSPRAAARLAARAWMTVPRIDVRRDHSPPGGAEHRLPFGRTHLAVTTWGEGPPVYLLHGWGGWRGQLGALVEPLADRFQVITLDAPGHGTSGPGRFGRGTSSLLEFVEALGAVVGAFGRPAGLIGHSMGGTACALAVQQGLSADALVMINSPADPLDQFDRFARLLRIRPAVQIAAVHRLERMVGQSMGEFDLRFRAAPSLPILLLHDRDDREIPYGEALVLAEAWPRARLVTSTGLGHNRVLRDPVMIQTVAAFLAGTGTIA